MFKLGLLLLFAGWCGASSEPHRIVGGQTTTIDRYPSLVAVEAYGGYSWSQSCAGTILNSRFILSAAHCFEGVLVTWRRLRAGATYRNSGGELVYFSKATIHPDYGKNGLDGDIVVVETKTQLTYNAQVQQGTIVTQNFNVPDNSAVIHAGWGTTSQGGVPSSQLRDVTIYTINLNTCKQQYQGKNVVVTENMICAGILGQGGKDACQGDSGGPMYYGNVVVGIVSGGEGCAQGQYPGTSTRVASYSNWVVSTAK